MLRLAPDALAQLLALTKAVPPLGFDFERVWPYVFGPPGCTTTGTAAAGDDKKKGRSRDAWPQWTGCQACAQDCGSCRRSKERVPVTGRLKGMGTIFGGIVCRKVKCGNPKARGYRACRNGDPPGAPRISRGQVGYAPSGALRTHGHVGIDGEDGEVVTGW